MVTPVDYSSKYAGYYTALDNRYSCLLDEGAITVGWAKDETGRRRISLARAAEITEGMPVALKATSDCKYDDCKGLVVVTAPTASNGDAANIVGRVTTFEQEGQCRPATTAAADTLAKRIAGGFLRCAGVEFNFGIKFEAIKVSCDGATEVKPGQVGYLILDISLTAQYGEPVYAVIALSSPGGALQGSSNVIPLHYIPAGTAGDIYTCMVVYTGPTIAQA